MHRRLNDQIFRNSKYINLLNRELNCDFRKEYKEQYDFMLDTFSTYILLFNCFYSDNDLNKLEQVGKAQEILEEYIYSNIDEDKKKYSVRFIQRIPEKYCTYLYRKMCNIDNGWYERLKIGTKEILQTTKVDDIKKEIKKEMERLEKIGFDNNIKGDFEYKRNKDSNYKIYISKFDELNTDINAFLSSYKAKYFDDYGKVLDEVEISKIGLIYDLVAYANNGLMKIIHNIPDKIYNLNERSNPQEIFESYLDSLDINLNDMSTRFSAYNFMFKITSIIENPRSNCININELINNFDILYFMNYFERVNNISIENDYLMKIINDLKEVYILLMKSTSVDDTVSKSKEALKIIAKIIERNEEYFIRLS